MRVGQRCQLGGHEEVPFNAMFLLIFYAQIDLEKFPMIEFFSVYCAPHEVGHILTW